MPAADVDQRVSLYTSFSTSDLTGHSTTLPFLLSLSFSLSLSLTVSVSLNTLFQVEGEFIVLVNYINIGLFQ